MRILHVISTLSPASGGTTEVLRGLAPAQMRAGHQVTVCTTDRDNPDHLDLSPSYFQNFYPPGIDLQVFSVSVTPLLIAPKLARWLDGHMRRYDVVHIHGLYRFPPSAAAWKARRLGTPYVVSPHGSLDPYIYQRSSRSVWLKRLYERFVDIPNLRGASAIHYTAEAERARASFLGLQNASFVVPNGLDWDVYQDLPERGALRSKLGLGNAPVVLFLGRLHPVKGLDILIPAFRQLSGTHPDVRLLIAGPDDNEHGLEIKKRVRESGLDGAVIFTGALRGRDVLQAYVDADIFTLPSYSENFGMTVAEAMACRIPVVISDQVKIHDQVTQVGAGLVTPCEPEALSQALQSLLNDPAARHAMGSAGRALVQSRYTWGAVQQQLADEYRRMIESHKRHA